MFDTGKIGKGFLWIINNFNEIKFNNNYYSVS